MLCIMPLPPRVAVHGPVSQMARVLFGVVSSILTKATTADARLPIAS